MAFIVEESGGSFEACPSGMHLAKCYRIVDLGTQKSEYMGQVKYLHKIMLGWEIHTTKEDGSALKMRDGRPFAMFKNYTLSWSEKANLRLDLQSWRGKPFTQEEMRRFDLETVLGAWCLLNVIERPGKDGKNYVNIDTVTPVPPMMKKAGLPEGVNKIEMFNLDKPDMNMFESFSDKLKVKIMASPEWQKLQQSGNVATTTVDTSSDVDDDIPF
jgi:hypothetical protein